MALAIHSDTENEISEIWRLLPNRYALARPDYSVFQTNNKRIRVHILGTSEIRYIDLFQVSTYFDHT